MIDLQNVTKTFDGFKALDDLNMSVPRGAVYGLVGPNGAGKSTAIRCLLGVYRPDSGTVTIDSQPVYENPDIKKLYAEYLGEIGGEKAHHLLHTEYHSK